MPSRFLNVLTVSLSTVGSRILGLFRDILVFSIFGSSVLNSAFILANTFPNLFRRLLGEGALTAALLPLLTEEKEKHGKERLFWLYNKILCRVMTLLFALVALVSFVMIVVGQFPGISQRWDLALLLGVLLFPYMALICLAATFAAALNALQRFAIPALTAVWLNLSIILFLGGLGYFATEVPLYRMYWLCCGVLVGGIFQLMIPWMALRREGWRFDLDFKPSNEVKEFGRLLLPGILGASVIQINILVSRSLAHFIDESAVSIYYLANRLVELPLGIFTIAIATVYFPTFSECASRGDKKEFGNTFRQSIRLMFAITVPAMVGFLVMGEPIIAFLFEWGAFRATDTALTIPLLWTFALGLPFYSMVVLLVRGFYAFKDTQTPMKISIFAFVLNLILSLVLMQILGVVGLALANVLAILGQTILLTGMLSSKLKLSLVKDLTIDVLKIAISSVVMVLAILGCRPLVEAMPLTAKGEVAVLVLIVIPVVVVVYFGTLWLFRFSEMEQLRQLLQRFVRRNSSVD
ncbi:murein biosynthesis integral membrane protein MurJ [Opitutia bacterium ISCC 51]|nr:murein biosynthesis integral membrane protein MurJ [Opitutae bacterium ISCC 51]QXD27022.1 murein biosynthesis integral membrane protein MurJ [Opitutae bacterium ISCC 52]